MIPNVLTTAILGGIDGALLTKTRNAGILFVALGLVGLALGFFFTDSVGGGWAALLTATVIVIGLAMVGPLLSAIFQMTGSKWGRVYARLAEGSVVLMPIGLLAVIALLAGGNAYLPWVHEHPHAGGRVLWLTRGFWDARVLGALLAVYSVGFAYVRFSVRRDFCLGEVRGRLSYGLSKFFARGITKENAEAEAQRCGRTLTVLAPIVAISYAIAFTLLGIDLIMALEPEWYSTLFGLWYFVGNTFCGIAVLLLGSRCFAHGPAFAALLTPKRQADLATLMLAFCLVNVDFFWNQYLTIWYANLPEETFYLITRTVDTDLPWRGLSFVSLAAFFLFPFLALLLRKVKRNSGLLTVVGLIAIVGIVLARFIEIAPALMDIAPGAGPLVLWVPVASSLLILVGLLGGGLLFYCGWMRSVPMMPVNDEVFLREYAQEVAP